MNAIVLTTTVQSNHEVRLTLPEDVPVGASVTVVIHSEAASLEQTRDLLAAAGKLASLGDLEQEAAIEDISDEEMEVLGQLPPDAPSSLEFIQADRGNY